MDLRFKCKFFSDLNVYELYAAAQLRQRVFVVEQQCAYQDADGKDPRCYHLMGFNQDDKLVAYARMLGLGVAYPGYTSIGRIVTAPDMRGRGYGRHLVEEALERVTDLFGSSSPVKISAQSYLVDFYQSFGFVAVDDPYLEDDIPHQAMIKR